MSKSRIPGFVRAAALIASGAILAACGGGGGGGTAAPPSSVAPPSPTPPPTSSSPGASATWTQGVFDPSATYKSYCVSPRSGVDQRGQAFDDMQGVLADELFWLRSWSDETYLWNTEIVDRNPAGFSNRLAYFDVLRTDAVTASGAPRDKFHFTRATDEYLASRLSTPTAGYGFSLVAFSRSVPRDYRIRYTQANTPASAIVNGQVNFMRGTRILRVDGADLVNGGTQADVDTINAGLFPANAGESHTFVVQDAGSASTRTVTVTSADIVTEPVNRTQILSTPTGDVGYILYNTFGTNSAEAAIANAITTLDNAGVTDLILDLRYNGGGFLDIAAELGYMIAGPSRTSGRTFDELIINNNPRNPLIGQVGATPFHSVGQDFSLVAGTPLNDLNLGRVYILSTASTCSASEAVINGLRGIGVEVVLIGQRTCGKPYGFIATDNCGETYFTIQFGGINDVGFGEYSDGFLPLNANTNVGVKIPGCSVADDYNNELGDPNEALLSAALNYRANGTCPTPSVSPKTETVAFKSGMSEVATTRQSEEDELILNGKLITIR